MGGTNNPLENQSKIRVSIVHHVTSAQEPWPLHCRDSNRVIVFSHSGREKINSEAFVGDDSKQQSIRFKHTPPGT
jgi:hypothetical protein